MKNGKMRALELYPAPLRTADGDKRGFINNRGEFIIKPQYEHAFDFQDNGLAIVSLNNLYGIIDSTGKYIVKPKYGSINQFSEGRAAVIDKQGFKVIDEKGNELTNKAYSFIGSYHDGRAVFADTNLLGKYLYGYLDRHGKAVIPLRYEAATDFNNGKAVVKIADNKYALIGTDSRIINTYNYALVGNLSDGYLTFQQSPGGKFGYINEAGKVVIEPKFSGAGPFMGGRAVVNISEDYTDKIGLIDKEGKNVIQPEYNDIRILGENRIAVGKALDPSKPFVGSKFAIADDSGKFLTNFIYYGVSDYKNGLASAYDNKNTFFIDASGQMVKSLPELRGSGSLSIVGDLIKADVDNRITYFNKAGDIVWRYNTIIPLDNVYRIRTEKYKPNKDYLVYYPIVEGMANKTEQRNVNDKLKMLSQVIYIDPNKQLDYSYSGDFQTELFQKQLLVLELDGYRYSFGAAHGMPSKLYAHIDLVSGVFYELKDLFKPNSNYVAELSRIIGEQIKNNKEYEYVFPGSYKRIKADQPFYVDRDALYIYFYPYEIAPFAAGFPTFRIPYKEIMNLIDINGSLWKSFH